MGNITHAYSNVLESSEGTTWKTCAYTEHVKIQFRKRDRLYTELT